MSDRESEHDTIAINEVQLLLAEKRTSLSVMRTGIAVLALPLSVMSVLVATSKYYDIINVLHLLIPLGLLCAALVFFGAYLILKAILRMQRYDRMIHDIKAEHSLVGKFID